MGTSLVGYEGAGAWLDGRGLGCICVTDHNIRFGRGVSLSPGKTHGVGSLYVVKGVDVACEEMEKKKNERD